MSADEKQHDGGEKLLPVKRRRSIAWHVTRAGSWGFAGALTLVILLVGGITWYTATAYFQRRVTSLGMDQVLTAPRSPWQKDYASHCTSLACSGVNSGRRLWENLTPWALRGGCAPGCSYSQSGLAVYA